MKAGVVSESIHPAILDSKLLVEVPYILDGSGGGLRERMTAARMAIHWNAMNAVSATVWPLSNQIIAATNTKAMERERERERERQKENFTMVLHISHLPLCP